MLIDIIGHRIIELKEVDSTNSYAARLLFEGEIAEGTVVRADYQNSGRGQQGARWESLPEENLLISCLLKPVFLDTSRHFLISQVISLALVDFLRMFTSSKIRIKWPNDIMAGDCKIAGILVENTIRNNRFVSTIAGIGININQIIFKSFSPPATSLAILESSKFEIKNCLTIFLKQLNKWYVTLQQGNYQKIISAYNRELYLLNESSVFETSGKKFSGVIRGSDASGRIIIFDENDSQITFGNKEVKYLF